MRSSILTQVGSSTFGVLQKKFDDSLRVESLKAGQLMELRRELALLKCETQAQVDFDAIKQFKDHVKAS